MLFLGPSPDHCAIPIIEGGIFIAETTPVKAGVKGMYQCYLGFQLQGNSEQVCTISKKWFGQPAQCVGMPPRGKLV